METKRNTRELIKDLLDAFFLSATSLAFALQKININKKITLPAIKPKNKEVDDLRS